MRTGTLLGAVVMLGLGVYVLAQAPADSFFTGVSPRDIKVVPVDVSKAMKTLNINQSFRTPQAPTPFTLASILPRITLPSWPPNKAVTPMLPKSPFQNITQLPPPKKK